MREFDFIDWVRSQQTPTGMVSLPAGDDMAVMKWPAGELLLVGVDQVLDGVHFDSAIHSYRAIGRKVMNRNLSDCAAMACLPTAAVATVALPHGTSLERAKELYWGLQDAADVFDCRIIGGDTAGWNGRLAVTVTIMGHDGGIKPLRRDGAKPDDGIYVTGSLGGSILGRHMSFEPRIRLARELARHHPIHAMIDLSDGLSRDLHQICRQSRVGAIIDGAAVPIHGDVRRLPPGQRSPLEHAVHDGEDYELLFTTPVPLNAEAVTRIGTITADSAVLIQSGQDLVPLEPLGWEHVL